MAPITQTARQPRPAIGYARVSTDEQAREGVSLEAQVARIRAYAQAKELELADVLTDEGISGKTLERPALRELLQRCERGEVGHVVVVKLDRLTRSTRDLLALVDDLFLARRIELHSVSESLDTSSPHGKFVLTLFGGLAQMERELIGERTRSALAFKRENGQPTSHPPLGFRVNGSRKHRMLPVPKELEIVRQILDLWRSGLSYRAIVRKLNEKGVPTKRGGRWYHGTVARIVHEAAMVSGTSQRILEARWIRTYLHRAYPGLRRVDTWDRACPHRAARRRRAPWDIGLPAATSASPSSPIVSAPGVSGRVWSASKTPTQTNPPVGWLPFFSEPPRGNHQLSVNTPRQPTGYLHLKSGANRHPLAPAFRETLPTYTLTGIGIAIRLKRRRSTDEVRSAEADRYERIRSTAARPERGHRRDEHSVDGHDLWYPIPQCDKVGCLYFDGHATCQHARYETPTESDTEVVCSRRAKRAVIEA